MAQVAKVTDLGRIAKPVSQPITAVEKVAEIVEKELTPEEEDEMVYRKVLKRKRDTLEEGRKNESTQRAEKIKQGIERRKKIMRIKNWCAAFKDSLGDFIKDKHLEKLSDEELDALLEECKFIVSSKTTGIITDQTAVSMIDWIEEGLTEHTSLKVAGPKVSLKQLAASKDCSDLIKELSLEYADFIYQRPEYRMVFFLLNGVYAIHKINEEVAGQAQPPPVKPSETSEPATKKPRHENEPLKDKDGYEIVP